VKARLSISLFVLILLAVNVLLVFSPIDFALRRGAISFPARSVYKPLLLLDGAFVLNLLIARRRPVFPEVSWLSRASRLQFAVLLAVVVSAVYLPVLSVNFQHHDWTHRHISASLNSLSTTGHLFLTRQADGMYRPLTFLSLAVDYHVFGPHLWGYHLQSIAIHVLNTLLVGLLATHLGLSQWSSRFAALLFGLASVHFEAILWPAARFDLLATLFSCLTLLFFLRHRHALAVLSFIAAVLSKEVAYSLLLVIPMLVFTRRIWKFEITRTKIVVFLGLLVACAAVLVAVRFAVYGSIGGYSDLQGHSVHFVLTAKSIYLLIVNSLALSVFGINTTVAHSVAAAIIVIAFACIVVTISASYAGDHGREKCTLVVLTLMSAAPVVNVIGWIQPSLQHSRHLYWPSVWMVLLLALALEQCRWRSAFALMFLVVQAVGLTYNIRVYRDLFERTGQIASRIEREAHAVADVTEVRLVGVPESPNGVFYFSDELTKRINDALPGVVVRSCHRIMDCDMPDTRALSYKWDGEVGSLIRR
jgi:hypothetical protein